MVVRSLLLAALLGLAAAATQPSCSPGDVCLGDEEVEDGSLIQKRTQDAQKAGGDCIQASGKMTTTSGTLSDFTAVSVSASIEVKFQTGSTSSYTASVDTAIKPYLSVKVSGSTLTIGFSGATCIMSTGDDDPVTVTVTAPEFPTKVTVSGSSEFENVGGSTTVSSLTVSASGQGKVDVEKVTSSKCDFTAEGQSKISDATCDTLTVDGSGQATIEVTVTGSATGSMSGQSTLEVSGSGSTSGVETSGQASVTGDD